MFTFRRILKGLLLIAGLITLVMLIDSGRLSTVLDKEWIDSEIRGQGLQGQFLFVAIAALLASFGLPRQVVAFMAGYGFGFSSGVLLAMLAIVSACVMSFSYGYLGSLVFTPAKIPLRMQYMAAFIKDHTFVSTLMIRLLPAGSNLLVNLTAGAMRIRRVPFFSGTLLGYIPQTLVFTLIGSGVHVDPGQRIGLGVVLFVLSALLGAQLYRKYRERIRADVEPGF